DHDRGPHGRPDSVPRPPRGGRGSDLGLPGRRDHAVLPRTARSPAAAARARAPRAGGGPRGRRLRPRERPDRGVRGHVGPGRDVPQDVQNQRASYEPAGPENVLRRVRSVPFPLSPRPLAEAVAEAARLIAAAERPLLMVGHGVILGDAYEAVRRLAERTGIPVITTLLGISAFPESHPLHLGMPGMHGEVHVNRAIQPADLIVGLGLRFDDRVTGNTTGFAPRATIVHVDLDVSEIGKNVPTTLGIVGGAHQVVTELLAAVAPRDCIAWLEEIHSY